MKKSLIVAGMLLVGTSVMAQELNDSGKWFAGIGMFNGSGTETAAAPVSGSTISVSAEADYDASSVPVTIGYVDKRNNRLKLSYSKIDVDWDDGDSDSATGFDFNYDFTLESIKSESLLPYIGIGIGFYNADNTAQYYVDGEDLKGVSSNLSLGLLYSINSNVEIEAAYSIKHIKWQDTSVYSGSTRIDVSMEEDISGLYAGINYKF